MLKATNRNPELPGCIVQARVGTDVDQRVGHLAGQGLRGDETRQVSGRREHRALHSEERRKRILELLVEFVVPRRAARRRHIETTGGEARFDGSPQGAVARESEIITTAEVNKSPAPPEDLSAIKKMQGLRERTIVRSASLRVHGIERVTSGGRMTG